MLQEREVSCLFQINGFHVDQSGSYLSGFEIKELPESGRSCSGNDATIMWNGPGMWMFESVGRPTAATLSALRDVLQTTGATVTDLSCARTIIRMSGSSNRDLLKKGCPVDIDAMQNGDVVSTLVSHLGVTIHCHSGVFDVYALQSFGTDFWEWCSHNTREFNV